MKTVYDIKTRRPFVDNKHQRNPKWQSRKDDIETQSTLVARHRRNTKRNTETKTMNNMDHSKNRRINISYFV